MKKKLVSYSVWIISVVLPILLFFIISFCYPTSIKLADLSSYISLVTQVLSILVGFSFVGTTLYLSGYSVSDKVSSLLNDIEKISNEIKKSYLDGPPRKSKITSHKFISSLMLRTGINQLKFYESGTSNEKNSMFYIFRPYWDGVWYQIKDSPLFDKNKSKEELFCIGRLHEVVVCSAKVVGIIHELRENNINLIKDENGSNGSIWFIEAYEKLIKKFPSLKDGETPDKMELADAITLTNVAIDSEHYMFEELAKYSEEINWDPYELTYFEVLINEYMLWLNYLIMHVQLFRIISVEKKYQGISSRFTDTTKENIGLKNLSSLKQKIFLHRKQAINAFGINNRYKEIKKASIPGIGVGIFSLLLMVLLWPVSSALSDINFIKYLFAMLYTIGLVGVIFSSLFVIKMLLETIPKLNRSPMGKKG